MVVTATYCAINLSNVLDKFIGILGALFCGPLTLIIPSLCHLKHAQTNKEKVNDIIVIVIALAITTICLL